jgi:membrane protein
MVTRIARFLQYDIWNMHLEQISATRAIFLKFVRVIVLAIRGFGEDKCLLRASALTFYTLLSIVPVAAMAFGVAKGFGFEKLLERQVMERMQGQEEVAGYIIGFADSMLENTQGGMVAGVGIAFLLWAVIKLLGNMEASFNAVWGVSKGRSIFRKCSDYFSAMLLCPILLIMAGSMNVVISGQVRVIIERLPLLELVGPAIFMSLKLLPYIVMWALLSFLYIFMPNTRVSPGAAVAGGIVAGTLYQVLQLVYISFQVGVAQYNAVYGGFAALPFFLIWLHLSWLVVLLGAEICFAYQHADTYEFEPECRALSPSYKKLITIWIMHDLVSNFEQGRAPVGVDEVSSRLRVPARLVRQVLSELVGCGLAAEVNRSDSGGIGYLPARDIAGITVAGVIDTLDSHGVSGLPVRTNDDLVAIEQRLEAFRELIAGSPENSALRSL